MARSPEAKAPVRKQTAISPAAKKAKVTATPQTRMLDDLLKSGLTASDAKKLQLEPMTEEQSTKLGLQRAGAGFLIPYFNAEGERLTMYRYRYFDTTITKGFGAGAKLRKYDQPQGSDVEIYLPQLIDWIATQKDANVPIFITEGEKKAAYATKRGYATIGVGGVWSFGRKSRRQRLLPALEAFKWSNRDVYICYDSDAITNHKIVMAENRLAREISDKGAQVRVVRLPENGDQKVGLDDYLVGVRKQQFENLLNETELWLDAAELHRLNGDVLYIKHPSIIMVYPTDDHPKDQPRYRTVAPGKFQTETHADRHWLARVGDRDVIKRAAVEWIKWPGRAVADSLVYEPGKPLILTNGNQFNMWEGWGAEPIEGDVSLFTTFIDHIFRDAPHDQKWFLQWLAYPIQHPGVKMNTAVVMWSMQQGTGKTLLGYTMKRIYGENFYEIRHTDLSGTFNNWARNRQFVLGDEITGGESRNLADTLKSMITEQDLVVNEKFVPAYKVRNCINYYFTSNHTNAFFIDNNDRRFFVHEMPSKNLLPPDFFRKRYNSWYQTQEAANALMYYLLSIDTSDFDPMAEAPWTESKKAMVADNYADYMAWIAEMREHPDNKLRGPGIPGAIVKHDLFTVEELLGMYNPIDAPRAKSVSAKTFSNGLKHFGYRQAADGTALDTGDGRRQRLWCIRKEDDAKLSAVEAAAKYQDERSMKTKKTPSRSFAKK